MKQAVLIEIDVQVDMLQAQCDALSSPPGTNPTAQELLARHEQLKARVQRKADLEEMREQYMTNLRAAHLCRELIKAGRGTTETQRKLDFIQAAIALIEDEVFNSDAC